MLVSSAAQHRATYLRQPDLGRKLGEASRPLIRRGDYDTAIVIADGLSAPAVHSHAVPFLDALRPLLEREQWRLAPLTIVLQGRVAVGDEIGELWGAQQVVVLIGERPGLSSPGSLGIYLTWNPRPGRADAERNCISNVRTEGLSYGIAARKLHFLMREARVHKISGIALKEDALIRVGGGE